MSHIKNIEIKNFKSIRHATIEDCRRVNVFIGYPNVGKSNILEAMSLYSVLSLSKGENFKFDDICRVKHFSELYFNHNYREEATITFNKEFELKLEMMNREILELVFGVKTGPHRNIQKDFDGYLKFSVEQHKMLIVQQGSKVMVFSKESDFRHPSYPIKKYSFINDSLVSNISSLGLSIPNGNNLLEVLQREPLLRKDLAEILQTYELKLLLDSSSGSIMLIKELGDSTVLRIPYHQIADTLKRLIFFKAAIQSNSDSVLLFEEPEAHMFPPYISKFTTDVMYDKNNNQFFIATHSPFVLNDFMEDMKNEDLAIYAVGYLKGETTINRLTDKQVTDIYQYGVDLFFNLEEFLKDVVS